MAETSKIRVPIDMDSAQYLRRAKQAHGETRKLGAAGKGAGRDITRGLDEAGGAAGRLETKIKGLITGYLGFRTVLGILRSMREETQRIDERTQSALESMRGVMALTDVSGRRQEIQRQLLQMAATAGRPVEQIAPAYYTLLGGTAGMAPGRQAGLMRRVLEFAKTEPAADINALVGLFTTMATQQPGMSPQQISNILSKTIEMAKATPSEMAQALPAIMTTARVGRVPVPTAAGMFTLATRLGGGVAESGTAVRAALLGLMAPPPETAKAMEQFGFPTQGDAMSRLQWLQERGMQLPEAIQARLGGRRGIEAISAIAMQPQALQRDIGQLQAAMADPRSLIRGRLTGLYGEMPAQRMMDQISQLRILRQLEDVQPEEAREIAQLEFRGLLRRRLEKRPYFRKLQELGQEWYRGITGDVMPAPPGLPASMEQLVLQGYAPADVMRVLWPTVEPWFEEPYPTGPRPTTETMERQLRGFGVRRMNEPQRGPTTQPTTQPVVQNITNQYNQTPGNLADNAVTRN